jgi:ankyrin repeat protein
MSKIINLYSRKLIDFLINNDFDLCVYYFLMLKTILILLFYLINNNIYCYVSIDELKNNSQQNQDLKSINKSDQSRDAKNIQREEINPYNVSRDIKIEKTEEVLTEVKNPKNLELDEKVTVNNNIYQDGKKVNTYKEEYRIKKGDQDDQSLDMLKELVNNSARNAQNGYSADKRIAPKISEDKDQNNRDIKKNDAQDDGIKIVQEMYDDKKRVDANLQKKKRRFTQNEIQAAMMPKPNSMRPQSYTIERIPPNIYYHLRDGENRELPKLKASEQNVAEAFFMLNDKSKIHYYRGLVDRSFDKINTKEYYGNTMLMIAVYNRDFRTIMYLINSGANLDIRNDFGISPLHIAAINNNEIALTALLDAGADANIVDLDGTTPIMYAALTGNVYLLKRLVEHNADIMITNNACADILDFAYEGGDKKTIEYILSLGKSINSYRNIKSEKGVLERKIKDLKQDENKDLLIGTKYYFSN